MHLLDIPVPENASQVIGRALHNYPDTLTDILPAKWTRHQLDKFFGRYYLVENISKDKIVGDVCLESVKVNTLSNTLTLYNMCQADASKGWPNSQSLLKRAAILVSDFCDTLSTPNSCVWELNQASVQIPTGVIKISIDNRDMIFTLIPKFSLELNKPKFHKFTPNILNNLKKFIQQCYAK